MSKKLNIDEVIRVKISRFPANRNDIFHTDETGKRSFSGEDGYPLTQSERDDATKAAKLIRQEINARRRVADKKETKQQLLPNEKEIGPRAKLTKGFPYNAEDKPLLPGKRLRNAIVFVKKASSDDKDHQELLNAANAGKGITASTTSNEVGYVYPYEKGPSIRKLKKYGVDKLIPVPEEYISNNDILEVTIKNSIPGKLYGRGPKGTTISHLAMKDIPSTEETEAEAEARRGITKATQKASFQRTMIRHGKGAERLKGRAKEQATKAGEYLQHVYNTVESYSPQGLIAAKLLEILPEEYLSEESDADIVELYNIAGKMLNEFESDLVICEEFTYEDALLYFIDSINESKIGPADPSKRVIPTTRSDSAGKDKEPEDHSSGSSADVFQKALEQQQKAIEAKQAKTPLTINPVKTTDENPVAPGYLPSKTFAASSGGSSPRMPIGKGFSSAYKEIKKLEDK